MHHLANGHVSLKGLDEAAMEVMTTTDLMPAELASAKNHLARHYKEFDLVPPWIRKDSGLIKVEAMLKVISEIHDEKILVTLTDEKRHEVIEALSAILEPLENAAEPSAKVGHSALLDVRLREAEISLNFMN